MKHLIYLFSALLFTSFTVNADDTNTLNHIETNTANSYRGYGKSFIFIGHASFPITTISKLSFG